MNWDQIEGKWKQLTGSVRERWGNLTDDDIQTLTGQKDHLVGKIQERYGIAKAEAEKQADAWSTALRQLKMSQIVPKILKWVSIPLLLIAAVFSSLEARYEPWIDLVICLGAIFLVERAVWAREYFWAAGFVAMVILFSPVALMEKVLLSMGVASVMTFSLLLASFRKVPGGFPMLRQGRQPVTLSARTINLSGAGPTKVNG